MVEEVTLGKSLVAEKQVGPTVREILIGSKTKKKNKKKNKLKIKRRVDFEVTTKIESEGTFVFSR